MDRRRAYVFRVAFIVGSDAVSAGGAREPHGRPSRPSSLMANPCNGRDRISCRTSIKTGTPARESKTQSTACRSNNDNATIDPTSSFPVLPVVLVFDDQRTSDFFHQPSVQEISPYTTIGSRGKRRKRHPFFWIYFSSTTVRNSARD